MKKTEKIILIHGLFFHGSLLFYADNKLEKFNYDVLRFSYKTTTKTMTENADLLIKFVQENTVPGETVHFVAHSLGGILVRKAYQKNPQMFTGRIVTLGTPHQGSLVAKTAQKIHERILGGSFKDALDGNIPKWDGKVDLGSIAGSANIGIGQVFNKLEQPSDGTVSVSETKLENMTDHIQIKTSHTTLLYSKMAFHQIDYFLQNGKFDHLILEKYVEQE